MVAVGDQEVSAPVEAVGLEAIRTILRSIVGFVPYGFCGALMSIAAPYAWYEGGAVGLRATVLDAQHPEYTSISGPSPRSTIS